MDPIHKLFFYFGSFSLRLVQKFCDFVNHNDFNKLQWYQKIKSHQNLSDYIQLLFLKRFKVDKKGIIPSEKIINSCNCIYDKLIMLTCSVFGWFGDDL